jgi:hypothetical protein
MRRAFKLNLAGRGLLVLRSFPFRAQLRSRVFVFALAFLTAASIISALAPRSLASTTSGAPVAAPPGSSSTILASATWGVSNGKAFFRITKGVEVGRYKPQIASTDSKVVPAASGSCTETISDVTRSGGFYWATSQICSGYFGAQDLKTQMLRSSWSGPRGYGAWAYLPASGLASQSYLSQNWTIACNNGTGYYDYYPVMQGYASNLGSGPVVRSNNQLNSQDCGPNPP